jgi:cyanophycin synthetase
MNLNYRRFSPKGGIEMSVFRADTVRSFDAPNFFLPVRAICFALELAERPPGLREITQGLGRYIPAAKRWSPDGMAQLLAMTVLEIQKLDMELHMSEYTVRQTGNRQWDLAVEMVDGPTGKEAVYLAEDLLNAVCEKEEFDFDAKFAALQQTFDRTIYGGPTIYSIIAAARKARIPMFYLPIENQFQWGYGRNQVRGRSTTISRDGIKDTEFTCYKDRVKEFLGYAGLPVPKGTVCFTIREALNAADDIGFPLVVKPVSGHKGQGVTTNITTGGEVERTTAALLDAGVKDGIIVEQQVSGFDHRLLTVGGKFIAALKREPAFVIGDGKSTIEELIDDENRTYVRRDNARSPLTKIRIDDDLIDYLRLQKLRLSSVLDNDEKVFLRRVANISAGGVSINVTAEIHPENRQLAEDVAAFLRVHCLGVDVLADDISKSWRESPLAIIEINAGPGVFMHLAPAQGGSIDAPGEIMRSLFPSRCASRIPIVVFTSLSSKVRTVLQRAIQEDHEGLVLGSASRDGIFVDSAFLTQQQSQWAQLSVLLRHERLDMALVEYQDEDILEDGLRYDGADIVSLLHATPTQRVLARDVEENGWVVVTSEQLPLGDLNASVRICLLDPDGRHSNLPDGVTCLATVVDGTPQLLGIDSPLMPCEGDDELPSLERLLVRALRVLLPGIVESYSSTAEAGP